MLTFAELNQQYLVFLSRRSSGGFYRRLYEQYFSGWTEHPQRMQIRQWHLSRDGTPSQANKGLGYLKAMYNWGINAGLVTDNPASGLRRHKTYSRDRVLDQRELTMLLRGLELLPAKMSAFLLLLLCTGCRGGEARTLRWDQLDLEFRIWAKSKTKNGRTQRMPVPRQAIERIAALPRVSDYVFPGHYGRPWSMAGVEKAWAVYRQALRLDVKLHDFRRTFATRLYHQTNGDLYLVKAALNHYDGSPTAVYVRLNFDHLAEAVQAHANSLEGLRASPAAATEDEFAFAS